MWQLWVILVLAIVAAIEYGRLRIQYHKACVALYEGPICMLFLSSDEGVYMNKLFQLAIDVRKGIDIQHHYKDEGAKKINIEFKNADKLLWYTLDKVEVEPIDNLEHFRVYIFADYALPSESIRATIDKLGLRNYVFRFSLIDEKGVTK